MENQIHQEGENLYALLYTLIQLFYTMPQLRKLHSQLALPSATFLYDLLKTAGTEAETPHTLKKWNVSYQLLIRGR